MSSAHLQLAAKGQEDRWLSESPDRTYFEAKYQPRVNRSRETYEVPLDNQGTTFGMTGRCTIPVKGDYLTRLTLRAVFPPIYPTVEGEYVYPTPSSQVGGSVYANMGLTLVVADGVTLTANTVGNHYMSVGTAVTLSGTTYNIFDLDGTYTVTSIPTANSFTCSTTLAGISYNGTMSFVGIACGDIISYFSTRNSNLWVNNLTNKTWQITAGSNVGTNWTFTTSAPSNFPVGNQVIVNLPGSGILNQVGTVNASTDTTFTYTIGTPFFFVALGSTAVYSSDNGNSWNLAASPIDINSLSSKRNRLTFGNGVFVAPGQNTLFYSNDNGNSWKTVTGPPLAGTWWSGSAFGNGVFVIVGDSKLAYSSDGKSWTASTLPSPNGNWRSVAYGNGVFVTVGTSLVSNSDVISTTTDYGQTWTPAYVVTVSPPFITRVWNSIAFGNGVFVMVGNGAPCSQAYSTDNGSSWTTVASPLAGGWLSVTFGNGVFVMVGTAIARSTTNGLSWTQVSGINDAYSVTFGNNVFVTTSLRYSTDNGLTWNLTSTPLVATLTSIACGDFSYTSSQSDSVSLFVPPLQLSNRVFSSNTYPSISFANASDAAFWGFDARNGLSYSLTATPPWTLTQSGWVSGFLPPSTSTWDDSVAHKLVRDARILVGKQTIKEYTGAYIELQNDLTVPYENKAILKLLNGTLDQTQATASREYYTTLPLGTKEIPLCALTHQQMSVEVDFEAFTNLSQNLNAGTGDFLDVKSYTTYNASTGILGGQPVNVQTTFSYQQYIFIVTYGGQFIVYDTTKDVADPASYIVLSAFSGTSLFSQFCVLSGTLYIGLSNGKLLSIIIDELIQGNTSSSILNNYAPTIGSLTGTIVADFRYVYYTVSNTVSSNVFLSRYDTTGSFTSPGSYTVVDFTQTFNSNVTGVYQTLSTGTQLIMLPRGTPGKMYTYQLNANVQSQWYTLDYSAYATKITEGVRIGNDSLYFIADNFVIVKYVNSTFTSFTSLVSVFNMVAGPANQAYSLDNGKTWTQPAVVYNSYLVSIAFGNGVFVSCSGSTLIYSSDYGRTWLQSPSSVSGASSVTFGNGRFLMTGYASGTGYHYWSTNGITWNTITSNVSGSWYSLVFGNGVFVMTGDNNQAYSTDNGNSWTVVASPLSGSWRSVAFGNGVFVMTQTNNQAYSTDNGKTWTPVASHIIGLGFFNAVAFGNGVFIIVSTNLQYYSTDNGQTWTSVASPLSGAWGGITFMNGVFVMVGQSGVTAYSTDNGLTWTLVAAYSSNWAAIAASPPQITIPGDGLRNLIAVGNYIYASTSNIAVQFDTTQDLSTAAAYKYPAPVLPDGQYVFANGPRYIYMFSQSDPAAQNIVRFDPYPPTPLLKTSILVDYESLPPRCSQAGQGAFGLGSDAKGD